MNKTAAIEIARSVRKRVHGGDCPTEAPHHRENIDEALVELLNIVEMTGPYLQELGFGESAPDTSCAYTSPCHHPILWEDTQQPGVNIYECLQCKAEIRVNEFTTRKQL